MGSLYGRGGPSQAELSGQLSQLARKRITKERIRIEQDQKELEECGIFTSFGDELHKALALIIGPEGTPYEHGFYFFDVQIPDNYPMMPPHVDFRTGDGRVRFNPNLYVEGKVCVSILGTWSGPSWTTSCSLRTVLFSIQSLLSEHPIQNEPGHEKECGKDDKAYSEIIRYENISVAVVRMLNSTPPKFEAFRPQMRRVFLKHFDSYLRVLEPYAAKEGSSARSPIWNFPVRYRTKDLIAELQALREKLNSEEAALAGAPAGSLSSVEEAPNAIDADEQRSAGQKRPADALGESEEAARARPRLEPKTEEAGGEPATVALST